MTRRPAKKRAARKAPPRRKAAATQAMAPARDPLDDLILTGAKALGIAIEKSWMPAVRENLAVTLRLGAFVTAFDLPDETEPAPVYEA
jgi:hypothetical protein